MRKIILFVLFSFILIILTACQDPQPSEIDCSLTPDIEECKTNNKQYCEDGDNDCIEIVERLLDEMTIRDKAAQMVQAERGSISPDDVKNYKIGSVLSGGGSHPSAYDDSVSDWYDMYYTYQEKALETDNQIPLIYGIDAVHGNNNLYGATIFPHNIGLGAANDPELMYDIGEATAKEMLVTGITWNFSPALSVVQDIRWGRTYEGYSENVSIHQSLGSAYIEGLQSQNVSATAKHFLADGATEGGADQGNVLLNEAQLRELHLPPYISAIEAGVDTIMISFSSINGTKMHGNDYWIKDVLKNELGFEGFIISDWNAIHQLPGDYDDQVVMSINAGVDMLMEPYDWKQAIDTIFDAWYNDRISEERINDAVKRILTVKYNQGLFDDPYRKLSADNLYSSEHQNLAREAARKSLVLLKNTADVLPLSKDSNIYLTGPVSDNIGYMCGGWTTYWQGNTSPRIGVGTSIKSAFETVLSQSSGNLTTYDNADTVVVTLTEVPYSEGQGDNTELTLTDLTAHPDNQIALDTAIQAHADGKTVIGILVSGRPLLLDDYLEYFDGFIAAWLPGSEGGLGISDVVFGTYDFTGKLPFTWPANKSQFGYNSNSVNYDPDSVLFPFGFGLNYNN